jgi:lipopolysaccharide assembly outer membrane protein LptD (OstA)
VVSGIPSPYVAGTAHSVTVTAKDAYGNVATGYRGTPFQQLRPGSHHASRLTFTAADAGVHRFSYLLNPALTLRTVGTQAVRARDTATATITGVQTGIVVS